jgi:putative tryptophan/tyrosine transport system substrate-binding protein
MTNRRFASGALGLSLLLPGLAARGQPRLPRLGWLSTTNPRSAPWFVAFERRLKELGHADGKTLIVDFAFAEGKVERFAPLARELVARKPDVLFVSGPEAGLKALAEASSTIPIVVCAVGFDPQVRGYVKSLARPGSNITGVHLQSIETTGKRLELLHDLLPAARRIAVLSDALTDDQLEAARSAAVHLKLELQVVRLQDFPYDYASALNQARSARSEALLVLMSPPIISGRERLAAEARKLKLPTVFGLTQFVEAGGLASYGASLDAMFVRSANYVDKIIKGEAPANLPMEQPTEFDLAVNFKLAKELGLKIPQLVLVRVTHRVE